MSVECKSHLEVSEDFLHAAKVKAWIEQVPDGAVIDAVMRDFGNQRDPDERLIGLRASWSEQR